MVDVSMIHFANLLVRTRVGQVDFVNLDFLLGHVNVAIHANTRAPQIPRRHHLVVLACLFLPTNGFQYIFRVRVVRIILLK
jgi:hypothetical protein